MGSRAGEVAPVGIVSMYELFVGRGGRGPCHAAQYLQQGQGSREDSRRLIPPSAWLL